MIRLTWLVGSLHLFLMLFKTIIINNTGSNYENFNETFI